MTIKKYEIEIDDELLQGKVPVAFRVPEENETWVDQFGKVLVYENCKPNHPRLILEKPYTPPSWLKPGWIYPNGDCWYWTNEEPIKTVKGNWSYKANRPTFLFTVYPNEALNFTPPTQRRPYKVG